MKVQLKFGNIFFELKHSLLNKIENSSFGEGHSTWLRGLDSNHD